MFLKYASNILQDLSTECMLKSLATSNEDDAEMLRSISVRLDGLVRKMGVEESAPSGVKKYDD